MAQQSRTRGHGMRSLARRYGLHPQPLAVIGCVVLVLIAGGVAWTRSHASTSVVIEHEEHEEGPEQDSDVADVQPAEPIPEPHVVTVHVDGAVNEPGVYRIDLEDPRIVDVVEQAGGLSPDAVTDNVNLAAAVTDGMKIHIPTDGEEPVQLGSSATDGMTSTDTASLGTSDGLVNINSATSEELQSLSGIGEATASAILKDREQNGPFTSVDDLMRVSGIGEKKLAKIRDRICV